MRSRPHLPPSAARIDLRLDLESGTIEAKLANEQDGAMTRWNGRLLFWISFSSLLFVDAGRAQPAPEPPPQTILPPGLYLFQTRTRDGNCGDAQRTGYVTSAVATLDGVPGSRSMTMQLLNSKYWPTWTLAINLDGSIVGSANMGGAKDDSAGSSRFEIRAKKDRYQGLGARSYPGQIDGKPARCTLNYDALLKNLD